MLAFTVWQENGINEEGQFCVYCWRGFGSMLQIRKWAERALGFRDSAVREIMSLCLRYTCVLFFLSVSQLMLRS